MFTPTNYYLILMCCKKNGCHYTYLRHTMYIFNSWNLSAATWHCITAQYSFMLVDYQNKEKRSNQNISYVYHNTIEENDRTFLISKSLVSRPITHWHRHVESRENWYCIVYCSRSPTFCCHGYLCSSIVLSDLASLLHSLWIYPLLVDWVIWKVFIIEFRTTKFFIDLRLNYIKKIPKYSDEITVMTGTHYGASTLLYK